MLILGSYSFVDINFVCFVVCLGWFFYIILYYVGLFFFFMFLDVISYSLVVGYLVFLRF